MTNDTASHIMEAVSFLLERKEKEMLKVLKNLKKSWIAVIIIVLLLCLQAATDLALPDYKSKIINTGIQARRN